MKKNMSDKTCKETRHFSPPRALAPVKRYFGGQIPLDPATEPTNPTEALKFFTEEDNGLEQPWDRPVFCNPPYGSGIKDWCKKFYTEATRSSSGLEIIALMPCGSGRPGTRYWQDYILQEPLKVICFVRGRFSFLDLDGKPQRANNYPSQFLGFNVDVDRFIECFSPLGQCLRVAVVDRAQPEPAWLPARNLKRNGRSSQGPGATS